MCNNSVGCFYDFPENQPEMPEDEIDARASAQKVQTDIVIYKQTRRYE